MNLFNFFNFFSHAHAEIAENGADKVLSSEEENPSVHKTYVNFPTSRKSALDVPLYAISSGRSMVEMLGVLAIIGVLSVGAIAGYSKAMFKYKLNKQAESFNMLLNNAIQLKPELNRAFNGTDAFTAELFDKLNLIPDGMSINNNVIHDIFNNDIRIAYYHHQNAQAGSNEYYISMSVNRSGNKSTGEFKEICRNIITIAKENSGNLLSIQMRSGQDETDMDNYTSAALLGDNYCANNPNQCLRYAGLTEMDTLCNSCDSDIYCAFFVFIDVKH